MDPFAIVALIVIALLFVGAAAAGFGADSREDVGDGNLLVHRAI